MNCEKIQDLILTDYLDGRMDPQWKELVEGHLGTCAKCKEFSQVSTRAVLAPFLKVEPQRPSAQVWTNIKESILAEQQVQANPLRNFWENLRERIRIPQPALAFAIVVVMVFMVGILSRFSTTSAPSNSDEQIEYFAQLIDSDFPISENNGFGTEVEEYFL